MPTVGVKGLNSCEAWHTEGYSSCVESSLVVELHGRRVIIVEMMRRLLLLLLLCGATLMLVWPSNHCHGGRGHQSTATGCRCRRRRGRGPSAHHIRGEAGYTLGRLARWCRRGPVHTYHRNSLPLLVLLLPRCLPSIRREHCAAWWYSGGRLLWLNWLRCRVDKSRGGR